MSVMGIGPGRLFGPISDVVGFSERDGLTHLEIQRRMRAAILDLIASQNNTNAHIRTSENAIQSYVDQIAEFATDYSNFPDKIVELDGNIANSLSQITQFYITPQLFDRLAGTPGHDSTVAVQNAVNLAHSLNIVADAEAPQPKPIGNGVVFFPKGTYDVNPISVPGSVVLRGTGGGIYGASVIRQRAENQNIIILTGDSDGARSQCSVIEDLTFKSVSSSRSGTVAQIITENAITSNSVYIRNCWFKTPENYAIWFTQGDDIRVEGCTFDVIPFNAIMLGSVLRGCDHAVISNNTFFNVALDAIHLLKGKGVIITGNKYYAPLGANPGSFIKHPGDVGAVEELVVSGNSVEGAAELVHIPTEWVNVAITGNTCRDLVDDLISIGGGGILYCLNAVGNTLYSETASAFTSGSAIFIDGSGLQISVISQNVVIAGAETAYLIDASDARVTNNTLSGNRWLRCTNEQNLVTPSNNGF